MKGSVVTVISENRHIVRSVTRALVSGGAKVRTCGFAVSEVKDALSQPYDLILIDADHDSFEVSNALIEVAKRAIDRRALVLCRELSGTIAELVLDKDLNHIIAKHGGVSVSRDVIDETELIVTCEKLISGNIFGLEKYLALPELAIHELEIDHSRGRQEVIDRFDGFLQDIDCYGGLRTVIVTVADELLMNAIFSAPRDASGNVKYEHLPRSDRFQLEPSESVTFRYGCDGRNVVMSVGDKFGSLDRKMLLGYIGSSLRNEKGQVSARPDGGAGLGLHLVVNSITQLVFNVDVGKRTEVIASFFIRNGIRGFRASGQSLNLFMQS